MFLTMKYLIFLNQYNYKRTFKKVRLVVVKNMEIVKKADKQKKNICLPADSARQTNEGKG